MNSKDPEHKLMKKMVQKRQRCEGNLSKRNALVNKTIKDFSLSQNISMPRVPLQLDQSI